MARAVQGGYGEGRKTVCVVMEGLTLIWSPIHETHPAWYDNDIQFDAQRRVRKGLEGVEDITEFF